MGKAEKAMLLFLTNVLRFIVIFIFSQSIKNLGHILISQSLKCD
jgi:hypothetical protein